MTLQYRITVFFLMFHISLIAQTDQAYFGQKPPGKTPEKFAPGLISLPLESEFGSVFSRDGKEFFYGVDVGGKSETRYSQLIDGKWTEPVVILSHETYGYNDPMLSPDETKLFFISDQPSTANSKKNHDIWYVERLDQGWSDPINAGPMINTASNEYYISFTASGAMYFSSNKNASPDNGYNFDIYKSAWKDGQFQEATRLSFNSEYYEADVFVAPDESYVIFAGSKPEGLGRGDLYISFHENGEWSTPQNMGEPINDPGHQLCPFVTSDGKYLFFTSNKDIYWVDASVIDDYRSR